MYDDIEGRMFIKHWFNKDGNKYRSPWSNKLFPLDQDILDAIQKGDAQALSTLQEQKMIPSHLPSPALHALERDANELLEFYTQLYYDKDVEGNEKNSGGSG